MLQLHRPASKGPGDLWRISIGQDALRLCCHIRSSLLCDIPKRGKDLGSPVRERRSSSGLRCRPACHNIAQRPEQAVLARYAIGLRLAQYLLDRSEVLRHRSAFPSLPFNSGHDVISLICSPTRIGYIEIRRQDMDDRTGPILSNRNANQPRIAVLVEAWHLSAARSGPKGVRSPMYMFLAFCI